MQPKVGSRVGFEVGSRLGDQLLAKTDGASVTRMTGAPLGKADKTGVELGDPLGAIDTGEGPMGETTCTDGITLGAPLGSWEGELLGLGAKDKAGPRLGKPLGETDIAGLELGDTLGETDAVGIRLGDTLGETDAVGIRLGVPLGATDADAVGLKLGVPLGATETVGVKLGEPLGG
jgi:hypothetical protein